MTSLLQQAASKLLKNTDERDRAKIAEAANLHPAWLRQLANNKIVDAGADKLERLHLHMTGSRYPAE